MNHSANCSRQEAKSFFVSHLSAGADNDGQKFLLKVGAVHTPLVPMNKEGEGFKGETVEKPFVRAIYIPLGKLKPSFFKSAQTTMDLMPVLVHLPAI